MFLAYDPATNPLNNNEWAFPLTECIHIASMALSIGTVALVDLRMTGLGMMRQDSRQLLAATELWTVGGLTLVIASGLTIFSSDPVMYIHNDAFQYKMGALAFAILYNYTVHRRLAKGAGSGVAEKLAGGFSLLVWISLAFAGIFTAFV